MSATHLLSKRTDLPSDRTEDRLVALAPANDDQPGHEMVVPNHRRFKDWPTLAALGAVGALTLGWTGVLVWALWRLISLAVF